MIARHAKNIFVIFLTVVTSSFTTPRLTYLYLIFGGSGTEKDLFNYTITSTPPSHVYIPLSAPRANWMRVSDLNDDGVSIAEFEASFETYDLVNSSSDLLKDESADISGQLDLFNKP